MRQAPIRHPIHADVGDGEHASVSASSTAACSIAKGLERLTRSATIDPTLTVFSGRSVTSPTSRGTDKADPSRSDTVAAASGASAGDFVSRTGCRRPVVQKKRDRLADVALGHRAVGVEIEPLDTASVSFQYRCRIILTMSKTSRTEWSTSRSPR